VREIKMAPINCPHCGKELEEPLFRFCPHCNGDISDILKIYQEKMKKQRLKDFQESEARKHNYS
jgi:Zn finger protein HypA/HybF involved in hydrogenase expression